MISRKEFLKKCVSTACATGLCCAASAGSPMPQNPDSAACLPESLKEEKSRGEAARARFALLIGELEQAPFEHDCKRLLHELGGRCADTFRASLLDRYKGNLNGFLAEGLRLWMAEAHYDQAAGTIRVVDKSSTCTCPLVKEGLTPPSFCDCTLGWQERAYSLILGRPVTAELEESILRGGKRCVFVMRVGNETVSRW